MIYAIGDIHGEAKALREMLSKLPVQPEDLVIFLGDIIDRGAASYDCVEQILAFDRCRKVLIQGNHEEAFLIYLEDGLAEYAEGMGGQSTLDSYAAAGYHILPGEPGSLPSSHARFYAQMEPWTLPFYITDHYIFTHAGWDLSLPLNQQSAGALRWGTVKGFENPVWTQTVVRGHVPFPKVTFAHRKQYIAADTGCGHGGLLSAVALPSGDTFTARPVSYRPQWSPSWTSHLRRGR